MAFAGQKSDTGLIDAISGVGDPWVAAMNTADLKRTLEGLPRGPGGQVDYSAAAMQLMGRHPLAAQQMMKMAQMKQAAGNEGARLQLERERLGILRDAENKLTPFEDDDGNKGVYRAVTGEAIYHSGVNQGRTFRMFDPGALGVRSGSGATPPRAPGSPRSAAPAVPVSPSLQAPSPSPAPAPAPAPAPGPTSSLMEPEDIELVRSAMGTPDYDRIVSLAAKKFGVPPQQVKLLAGGRSDMQTEGGNMRVAGEDMQLPEGVAEAMGQVPPDQQQGLLPTPPRQQRGPLDPNQPYSETYRPPGGREDRVRSGAFNKELAEAEAKQQVQNQEKAFQIRPILDNITFAENAYDKVAAAGLNNKLAGSGPVSSVLQLGRGAYKTLQGVTGGGKGEQPGRITAGIDAMSAFESNVAQLEQLARQATRGQGALSEGEGKQLRETLPSLSSNDPNDVKRAFKQVRAILVGAIRRGGVQVPDEVQR